MKIRATLLSGVIFPTTERVCLRIGYGETEPRVAVKAAGGFRDLTQKGLVLVWRKVVDLGLEQRSSEK